VLGFGIFLQKGTKGTKSAWVREREWVTSDGVVSVVQDNGAGGIRLRCTSAWLLAACGVRAAAHGAALQRWQSGG